MNALSNVVLIALLLWGGYSAYKGWNAASPKVPRESAAGQASPNSEAKGPPPTKASRGWFSTAPAPSLRSDSAILVYGPENEINTRTMVEALSIRGFSQRVLVPIGSMQQFNDLGITEALRAAGLVDARGNTSLPFISVDGELYSSGAVDSALSGLPLTNVRERETPYIVIYGPAGCPFTLRGREELDANNIPYEVRDVNDSRYQGHFTALLRAYKFENTEWPMLDINGRMFAKPSLEVVRANYR